MRKIFLFFLCSMFFLSCNSESERVQQLRKKMQELEQQAQTKREQIDKIRSELSNVWLRSLKYRFPHVREIRTQEISLDSQLLEMPYLKTINFKYSGDHKMQVIISYKTDREKVKPEFDFYLFNQQGINIYSEHIEYKNFLKRYLPVGKLTSQKIKVEWSDNSPPTHFLIRKK